MSYKRTISDFIFDTVVAIFCLCTFIVIIYPLYFILIASISDPALVATGKVWLWPNRMQLIAYETIIGDSRIWLSYKNTIIYTIAGTLLSVSFTLSAAYALSRKDFAASKYFMIYFVITMFLNGGLIPTYLVIRDLNLLNSPFVMFVPFCVNVFNLIISRTFFQSNIPKEVLEAAKIDGCSDMRFFFNIVLPVSKAIISVMCLYYAVGYWNDYFRALIYLRSQTLYPLSLILRDILIRNQTMVGGSAGDGAAQQLADLIKYGVIVVSTAPIIAIYPFIQKYFSKGVMIGSLKG